MLFPALTRNLWRSLGRITSCSTALALKSSTTGLRSGFWRAASPPSSEQLTAAGMLFSLVLMDQALLTSTVRFGLC